MIAINQDKLSANPGKPNSLSELTMLFLVDNSKQRNIRNMSVIAHVDHGEAG